MKNDAEIIEVIYGSGKKNSYDLKNFFEENSEEIKNEIILFVSKIKELRINYTTLKKLFSFDKNFSLWDLSLVNEKNVYKIKQKWKKYVSPQLTVPNSHLKKYKSLNIPVKKGNCLVMYPNLFHKSGNNNSKKIRFTILARFNKILTSDFRLFNKRLKP